jgi:hypothetical protein
MGMFNRPLFLTPWVRTGDCAWRRDKAAVKIYHGAKQIYPQAKIATAIAIRRRKYLEHLQPRVHVLNQNPLLRQTPVIIFLFFI